MVGRFKNKGLDASFRETNEVTMDMTNRCHVQCFVLAYDIS